MLREPRPAELAQRKGALEADQVAIHFQLQACTGRAAGGSGRQHSSPIVFGKEILVVIDNRLFGDCWQ